MSSSTQILPMENPPAVEEDEVQAESVTTHTRSIGIILPPPDIKSLVEKTAQFVGKNGLEFEKRIKASNVNNAIFNFLNNSDTYHAFYQHKLTEAQNATDSDLQPDTVTVTVD